MQPQCPHCWKEFKTWHEAKIHVKHCKYGKPRLTVAEREQRMAVKREDVADRFQNQTQGKTPDESFSGDDWNEPFDTKGETEEMPNADNSRPAFLKPWHVKAISGTLQLIEVSRDTTEFSDVVLIVAVGTRRFRLGLRTFSEEYNALKRRFGNKRSDWHGELRYRILPHKGEKAGYVSVR